MAAGKTKRGGSVGRRSWVLQPRYFGLGIALVIAVLVTAINWGTPLLERVELRIIDLHFQLKDTGAREQVQEGVTVAQRNPFISNDIMIVGIDPHTLSEIGRWPFPRDEHARLLQSFSRISDQNRRERALFFDIFFVEPGAEQEDRQLHEAMLEYDRAFLGTILERRAPAAGLRSELFERQNTLLEAGGTITAVKGDTTAMPSHFGLQPPIHEIGSAAGGYGHAIMSDDDDQVYRRQAMVSKSSELIRTVALDELSPGSDPTAGRHQRLVWFDRGGGEHTVPLPLDDDALGRLRSEMDDSAPRRSAEDGSRREHILGVYQDRFLPSITLALALEYLNVSLDEIEVELGHRIMIPNPRQFDPRSGQWRAHRVVEQPAEYDAAGRVVSEPVYREPESIEIPIDERGNMLINYMGPRSSPTPDGHQTFPVRSYSGYSLGAPPDDPDAWPPTRGVENNVLLVGAFAPGMADDELTTPFGLMYGIEVHANALNSILTDRFLTQVPDWASMLIILAFALVIAIPASRISIVWSALASLGLAIGWFFVTTLSFDYRTLILPYTAPTVALVLSFVAIAVYRLMTEEKDKRHILDMFGKYVSPRVVDVILEHPPELGGVDRELTVMFSDIRGFTTLSETIPPQELVGQLNEYLTTMTDIILEHEGTLDKYVGDEIMCFWGAPLPQEDHAIRACRCALRQLEALEELNAQWPDDRQFRIGIGINSGTMTVGNMGSQGRMSYTLIGDNVNLGSRLEAINKEYGTAAIISEYTYALVKDRVEVRRLDTVQVKGKTEKVGIYELIALRERPAQGSA